MNNDLWKTPKPHFVLQNSHGHMKGRLRNLYTIWAHTLGNINIYLYVFIWQIIRQTCNQ
jgi:hypothetical protein